MNRVFYHRMDLDGHASGAIARRWLEQRGEAFRLYPYDYADPFPETDVAAGESVWFLDVAWQPFENMARLKRERRCRVVLIDHHRSLMDSGVLAALEAHVSADNSRSACLLAWGVFFPQEPVPEWTELLSRYDVWDDADREMWRSRIHPFQMGMQAQATDPMESWPFWQRLFARNERSTRSFVNETIRNGQAILAWSTARNAHDAKDHAFEARLGGRTALCINSTNFSSSTLDAAWDPLRHDLMLIYARRRNGTYRVGLFTRRPEVDVSAIAGELGGGGHRAAAGLTARSVLVRDHELLIEPLSTGA